MKYEGKQGEAYEAPTKRGWSSIPVLQFLWGQPWDQVALNYVHALRPSVVRVVTHSETTDAHIWRVTVRLEGGVIRNIGQEVEVGLDGGFAHGHALFLESRRRGYLGE